MKIINGIKVYSDYTNKKYNQVTILSPVKTKSRDLKWLCRCDCGVEFLSRGSSVASGNTQSCGCLKQKIRRTHGMSKTRFYHIWQGMHQRVRGNIKGSEQYTRLGIEPAWESFEGFMKDMYDDYRVMEGEQKKLSIERIDNERGYFKDNCTWANPYQQARNRSISGYRQSPGQEELFEVKPIKIWEEFNI